ncbi:MAG: DUF1637 domain-containing protein [Erysipelotrichaceae bacterium]
MNSKILDKVGILASESEFKLVKKVLSKGELIEKHNHPESKVLFTVVKGEIDVVLNDDENFRVKATQVLSFDGNNYLSATVSEDSEVLITLINKTR